MSAQRSGAPCTRHSYAQLAQDKLFLRRDFIFALIDERLFVIDDEPCGRAFSCLRSAAQPLFCSVMTLYRDRVIGVTGSTGLGEVMSYQKKYWSTRVLRLAGARRRRGERPEKKAFIWEDLIPLFSHDFRIFFGGDQPFNVTLPPS